MFKNFFLDFNRLYFFNQNLFRALPLAGRKFIWKVANIVCWIDFFEIGKCSILLLRLKTYTTFGHKTRFGLHFQNFNKICSTYGNFSILRRVRFVPWVEPLKSKKHQKAPKVMIFHANRTQSRRKTPIWFPRTTDQPKINSVCKQLFRATVFCVLS